MAATHRILQEVDTDQIKAFQLDMLAFFEREHPQICSAIEEKKVLDDALTEQILQAAKEFREKR